MGVGRGISLQLLRLSRKTQPGHVGGSRDGGGGAGGGAFAPPAPSPSPSPSPSSGNPNSGWESAGNCWDPFSCYKDTPLSSPTADLAGGHLRAGSRRLAQRGVWGGRLSGEEGRDVLDRRLSPAGHLGIAVLTIFCFSKNSRNKLRVTQQRGTRAGKCIGVLCILVGPPARGSFCLGDMASVCSGVHKAGAQRQLGLPWQQCAWLKQLLYRPSVPDPLLCKAQ